MLSEKTSLHLVDPELRPILDVFTGFDVTQQALPMLRNLPASPALDIAAYREVSIARNQGEGALRALVIDPHQDKGEGKRPALLYMHGGGFVFGSPETILPTLQKLAKDADCVIVVPAYRLAPEFPFPAALDDNYLALSWMHDNDDLLGIDSKRIAIGGDSAGGGHACVLSVAARDRGQFNPIFQLLIYPMLDDATGSVNPAASHTGEFIWTADNNKFGWSAYLGFDAGAKTVPNGAVPARFEDVSGLPPALIATGSLDLFVGENELYSQRLTEQGVPVTFEVFEGGYHGFNAVLPEAKISRRFHDLCVKSLKQAFDI